jgi:TnpA family transposase
LTNKEARDGSDRTGSLDNGRRGLGRAFAQALLKTGHVTASVALKRLVGFSAKNRFYRANRDLGRIFKTEFILQYLSEPELRRRIRRGLLKVEQLHALARDVFYGRRPD